MAKAGMRRPDPKEAHGTESNRKTHFPKNTVPPVSEISGKAKHGHEKAHPVAETGQAGSVHVFQETTGDGSSIPQ